jgi:hypothetical protein
MKIGLGRQGKKRNARSQSIFSGGPSTFAATHSGMKGKKKAKLAYRNGKRVKGR